MSLLKKKQAFGIYAAWFMHDDGGTFYRDSGNKFIEY